MPGSGWVTFGFGHAVTLGYRPLAAEPASLPQPADRLGALETGFRPGAGSLSFMSGRLAAKTGPGRVCDGSSPAVAGRRARPIEGEAGMYITSYYFRAHTYTLVPRHVREDMAWMADHGTDAVAVGILEQDLFAAVENIQWIAREAERVGMRLFAVPSRWGGLIAGCPKVPSIFCARHPDAVACLEDGRPNIDWLGTKASVHHPATFDFFAESLGQMMEKFPVSGIIWDEVKNLHDKDYSPAARQAFEQLGADIDAVEDHQQATAKFFERINRHAVSLRPDLRLSMFLYGHLRGACVHTMAAITSLHDFGCDGRPYGEGDGGVSDSGNAPACKRLIDCGPWFVDVARQHGKHPLFLIENHAMPDQDVPIMDRRLPEIMAMGVEHLIYYYYPRSLADPDHNMQVIGRHLKQHKSS